MVRRSHCRSHASVFSSRRRFRPGGDRRGRGVEGAASAARRQDRRLAILEQSVAASDRHRAAVGVSLQAALKMRSSISSPGSLSTTGDPPRLALRSPTRSLSSFGSCSCCSPKRVAWCPNGIPSTGTATRSSRCGPRSSAAVGRQGSGRHSWPSLASRIAAAVRAPSGSRRSTAGSSPRRGAARRVARARRSSDTRCPAGHHDQGCARSTRANHVRRPRCRTARRRLRDACSTTLRPSPTARSSSRDRAGGKPTGTFYTPQR